jgi:hypothetical protein
MRTLHRLHRVFSTGIILIRIDTNTDVEPKKASSGKTLLSL